MNRPDHSLSLDSVICKRCNTVSPASEDTCPACGADRQGAIFTSRAAEAAAAAAAPVPAPLDILDWDDSHWLQRLVRRRMLTSYPNFVEPDAQDQRKPARTGMAMLVGGVIASIAVGGYFYARLDDNAPSPSAEPGISAAGSIRDGASGALKADAARHASLARSKADTPSAQPVPSATTTTTIAKKPAPIAETASVAPRVTASSMLPTTPHVAANAAPASNASPAMFATAKPATPVPTTNAAAATAASVAAVAPPTKPTTPVVASLQKPEPRVVATIAAAAPVPPKPVTQAPAPVARAIEQPRNTAPVARQSEQPRSTATVASIDKPPTPATPAVQPAPEPLPAAVARSIAAVQQALAGRDLAAARRHMRGLSASEPRSPEIQQLAAELSRQERARDGAIANARACAANMEAACALRNARRAVALDPRNGQAQATLRRALAVQNESNTEYFRQASGIPKPVVPTMTYDGRWNAHAHHAGIPDDDDSRFTLFGLGVPAVSKGRGDAH
ncbi:hypothetical protein [Caballeronia sp. ATUFL_F2_KS9A]|uniref:hypothetical protein n=1 Tax=Caballeronia sp. ATUFL_F2_KS9A TaxID=2921777 RepID=UPI002027E1BF|nr:hypothetical protein [Caballeronia sp. ATUFL_F2_KS9A]